MLKINLKQLEAFVATAEFSSFTKASEELFLTQSTVSSHVSSLETALGVRLIRRSARQRISARWSGALLPSRCPPVLCATHSDPDFEGNECEPAILDLQCPLLSGIKKGQWKLSAVSATVSL